MLAVSASSAFPAPDHSSPRASPPPAAAPVRPDGGSGRWRDLRTPLNRGDIGQFQRSAPAIIGVSRICCRRSNAPSRRIKICPPRVSIAPAAVSTFWLFSAAKIASGEKARGWRDDHEKTRDKCAPPVRRGYSLFHPGYMQQLLAQGFSVTHQLPRRLSRAFRAKRAKVTSANSSFIIGPETPAGRFFASSPSFFARLIKLLRHLGRRGLILQRQGDQRYAGGGYRSPCDRTTLAPRSRFSSGSAT